MTHRLRAPLALVAVAAVLTCSEDPLSPDAVEGTYTLRSVNDAELPGTIGVVGSEPRCTAMVRDGFLRLEGGTYHATILSAHVCGTSSELFDDEDAGSYRLVGGEVQFHGVGEGQLSPRGFWVGTVEGTVLLVQARVAGLITMLEFEKQRPARLE